MSPSTLQRSNCSVNGVPAGPGAGELEAVKFTDTVATAFEVVLVVGALALARSLPARRIEGAPNGLAASTVALVVAALTATALLSRVEAFVDVNPLALIHSVVENVRRIDDLRDEVP